MIIIVTGDDLFQVLSFSKVIFRMRSLTNGRDIL